MLETLLVLSDKYISAKAASRVALAGVIVLSLWSVGHASDFRAREVQRQADAKAISVAIEDLKHQIEANRVDAVSAIVENRKQSAESNAETVRRLERLESLLLRILERQHAAGK